MRGVYGGHHLLESESDQRRTDFLVKGDIASYVSLDHEVLTQPEAALQSILEELQSPSPGAPTQWVGRSPQRGEGKSLFLVSPTIIRLEPDL